MQMLADTEAPILLHAYHGRMLIGGKLEPSQSGQTMDAVNPATGELIGSIPRGDASDLDRAVAAAEAAQPAWYALPVDRRARYLHDLADALAARADDLLALEVADTGNSISGMAGDIRSCISRLRYFAGLGHEIQGRTVPGDANKLQLTTREPYGIVGRIVAFNHPAAMAIHGIASPLMAGNAVILKPSELCSLSGLLLGEIARDVLPKGVLSVVTGDRAMGDALVRHPKIKRLSFVGSVQTGMAIQRAAAEVSVKALSLELGGKNPFIVYPDAPVEAVAEAAVAGMNFTWQGQSCSSTSRLFLHDSIYDEVVERVVDHASAIRIGDPFSWETQMGAMSSAAQLEKTEHYVALGLEEGATLLCGGRRPKGDRFARGYWYSPTVFGDVQPWMRIAKEEIFGPILSVMRWTDEEEMIEAANALDVGLTGAVWSRDINTALKCAQRLSSGYIWVNGINAAPRGMPFGGFKNSGLGRERGIEELLTYTEEKSIQIFLK